MDEFAARARDWRVPRPGLQVNTREGFAKRAALSLRREVRTVSGPWRMLPSYLIVGAQKAGTSSLWDQLAEHPAVAPSELKEVDYFNWFYDRSLRWYRGFFPRRQEGLITGEASPDYLYDPRVPARVQRDLPEARIVIALRDPVERAISHYHHQYARGLERLSLEDALDAEPDRLRGERERIERDPRYRSMYLRHFSYLDRGRYAEQLERWLSCFERSQLLVLNSQQLFTDPRGAYRRVLDFLGLEPFLPQSFEARNAGSYTPVEARLRARFAGLFSDENERLFALLGERFGWSA